MVNASAAARAATRRASGAWVRWKFTFEPRTPGDYEIWTRATDDDGRAQPLSVPFNTFGYLYSAVVRHPVVVA